MTKPGRIPQPVVTNFEMLQRAFRCRDAALVSAIRKSDGANVFLVVAMSPNADGTITPIPFAEMIAGNPFELYEDPTA